MVRAPLRIGNRQRDSVAVRPTDGVLKMRVERAYL